MITVLCIIQHFIFLRSILLRRYQNTPFEAHMHCLRFVERKENFQNLVRKLAWTA